MTTLPLEFQRTMLKDMVRAALEVGDVTGAAGHLNEFEMVGVPRELEPTICRAQPAGLPKGLAAPTTRCVPTVPPLIPGIVRRRRRAGCARSSSNTPAETGSACRPSPISKP